MALWNDSRDGLATVLSNGSAPSRELGTDNDPERFRERVAKLVKATRHEAADADEHVQASIEKLRGSERLLMRTKPKADPRQRPD